MSTEEMIRRLKEELFCFICSDSFRDPVSIHCGHTFCRACITEYWVSINKKYFQCSQCRAISWKRILKPNRELGNIARIVSKLNDKAKEKEKTKERICQKHQEPLKLFCKNDQMAICMVCDKSKEHKDHTVFPVEQEFQDQLISLKKKREKLLKLQATNAARNKKALNTISAEMQKMSLAFRRIYQFLEEQKQLLRDQWKSLQTAVKEQEVRTATISEEISCLDSLITMAEERGSTVELEFLQAMQAASMRQTKYQELDGLLPEVEKGLAYQTRQNEVVTRTLGEFKATLSSELQRDPSKKRKSEDRTADEAFDCSPESGMCLSSSQQPDKRAPAGDNILPFGRKKEDSSSLNTIYLPAKKRKSEDRTANAAFDCSPESGMCFSSSQQPDKRAPAGDTKKKKSSQCPLF
ncbi:hypothetical protein Chor_011460 [Crotalus horridus]